MTRMTLLELSGHRPGCLNIKVADSFFWVGHLAASVVKLGASRGTANETIWKFFGFPSTTVERNAVKGATFAL